MNLKPPHLLEWVDRVGLAGFWPELAENTEGVVVVIIGPRRATSQLTTVGNEMSGCLGQSRALQLPLPTPGLCVCVGELLWFLWNFENNGFWGLDLQYPTPKGSTLWDVDLRQGCGRRQGHISVTL